MKVALSVVVVVHNMARELSRTLFSLSSTYQRDIAADEYELIVVDNGSDDPLDRRLIESFEGNARSMRIDPAPRSPAHAANIGIEAATGDLVGLIIDGARIASPGLLSTARLGERLADEPVITAPGYHLGFARHMQARDHGYDQVEEDALLERSAWEQDGYRLFEISVLAASSGRGWFGPMGESSSLFMPKPMWVELGGLDESFSLPGGGLVNHDVFRRACSTEGSLLVLMVGEGTFHQFHGGAATSRSITWQEMHDEYESIRGERYRPPTTAPVLIGRIPPSAHGHLEESVRLAAERRARREARKTQ